MSTADDRELIDMMKKKINKNIDFDLSIKR